MRHHLRHTTALLALGILLLGASAAQAQHVKLRLREQPEPRVGEPISLVFYAEAQTDSGRALLAQENVVRYRLSQEVDNATWDASSGILRWRPTRAQFRAFRSGGQELTTTLLINDRPIDSLRTRLRVAFANHAPSLQQPKDYPYHPGETIRLPLIAEDVDMDSLNFDANLTLGGFERRGPQRAIFVLDTRRGVPGGGDFSLTFRALDEEGASSQPITVRFIPIRNAQVPVPEVSLNPPPNSSYLENESIRFRIDVLNIENPSISYTSSNPGVPGGLISPNGLFEWTPPFDFVESPQLPQEVKLVIRVENPAGSPPPLKDVTVSFSVRDRISPGTYQAFIRRADSLLAVADAEANNLASDVERQSGNVRKRQNVNQFLTYGSALLGVVSISSALIEDDDTRTSVTIVAGATSTVLGVVISTRNRRSQNLNQRRNDYLAVLNDMRKDTRAFRQQLNRFKALPNLDFEVNLQVFEQTLADYRQRLQAINLRLD